MRRKNKPPEPETKPKTPEELLNELDGTVVDLLGSIEPPIEVEVYVSSRLNLAGVRISGQDAEGENQIVSDETAADVKDALARALWEALETAVPEDGKIGTKQQQSEVIRVFALALALAVGDKGEEAT